VYRIAPRSPAPASPKNNQFFFLCGAPHKKNYAEIRIIPSTAAGSALGRMRAVNLSITHKFQTSKIQKILKN
jgi:hypothetical protein